MTRPPHHALTCYQRDDVSLAFAVSAEAAAGTLQCKARSPAGAFIPLTVVVSGTTATVGIASVTTENWLGTYTLTLRRTDSGHNAVGAVVALTVLDAPDY